MRNNRTIATAEPVAVSPETMVRANGVDLCAQTFGDPADPAILLMHGATTSMYGWEDAFCQRLAAGGRFVIRYDQRDTGRSVSYPPGQPGYAWSDLAMDAVGLLDAFGLARAHLVGVSMSGGLAMLAALECPDRVASLTLIGTSPGGEGLPPMSEAFLAHVGGAQPPDWSDNEAVIDHAVTFLRIVSGGSGHFDEAKMRPLLALDLARTTNVASSQINHFAMTGGEPIRHRIGRITARTLVIHGAEDPVFPLGHAVALANEIPGAELLVMDVTGHELPEAAWDDVIPAMLRHTASAG